jgi:hypothetical protein
MDVSEKVVTVWPPKAEDLADLMAIRPTFLLVFGDMAHFSQPDFHAVLTDALPGVPLMGCSTAGEITPDGVEEGTCVLTAVRLDHATVRLAEARVPTLADSEAAGTALGTALAAPPPAGVLVFAKGVAINGSALIEGLAAALPPGTPISGGLAGDGGAFTRTLVLGPGGVDEDGAVALGLYGAALRFNHGSFGGWDPFGPSRLVTRAEGNILHELDGEPALNVYKRYLGDHAAGLPASGLLFPFEILNENHDAVGLIRTILGVDEETGSLILAGTVEEGGYLRLMHASTDNLIDGAETAAQACGLPETRDGSALALLVSCVGRKLVMGDQVDGEVEAVAEVLGPRVALTGFYSYGEISPMGTKLDCKLHNQTMTLAVLTEE